MNPDESAHEKFIEVSKGELADIHPELTAAYEVLSEPEVGIGLACCGGKQIGADVAAMPVTRHRCSAPEMLPPPHESWLAETFMSASCLCLGPADISCARSTTAEARPR